ncbi:S8 family peptidase [Rhodocyclus gracilis]|uniref:S8 family serine peptidase n=1 Tax=Rhodocyclus tenuis TaxID=1066 RepID=A0A6L5JZE5_RHOTE|nr:S8 family peptidase [Rhodocyclus gracilis]MQY52673.1 S8 family serine peptidase [Rhodocyclus gracilis]
MLPAALPCPSRHASRHTSRHAFSARQRTAFAGLLALGSWTVASPAQAQTYAPWLRQIGITNTVESAAAWGKGQLLGVVDTGINATHPQFAPGQVSQALSSCAAVSFRCSNGFADDNSHGTAVASIAAGNRVSQFSTITAGGYTTVAGNFIGVAPAANILSEKVLNAAGSGYSTDVANGVRKAADAGAGVINVSITYGNDAATVAAINYAAAKGAFIVWAGGNSAQNLLNNASTSGLTATAIQHLVFAGSVNSANAASSFTNKPGSGGLQSSNGGSTTYAARWVMAPGEAILAPSTTAGNAAYGLWSGTSMAAPIVSGSLMLLQNAWPILKTNGTAANLLLATATDLGSKGVDATYGNGLVNLTTAFNPYGPLSVTKANGQTIAVSSITGALISSGAFGSLSAIQSKLASYTAFDGYARNFSVNLAGLIKAPSSSASLNPLPTNAYSAPKVMKYAGGELAVSLQSTGDAISHLGEFGYIADVDRAQTVGFSLFTDKAGSVTGFGYGASSSYPFAKALFNDDLIARQMSDFDAVSASNLAQRGYQFSYGTRLSTDLRVAASYSATPANTLLQPGAPQNAQVKIGASYLFAPRVSGGLTYSTLNEQSSLLGAAYDSSGILALGKNTTQVVGISLAFKLDRQSSLLVNGEVGYTRASEGSGNSLFAATSALQSRAFGVTYLRESIWNKDDQLLASVKQPLRVSAGSAAIITANVDAQGYAVYDKSWSSLVPDGREIDLTLNYRMPVDKTHTVALQAMYQKDAANIAGNNATSLGLMWTSRF